MSFPTVKISTAAENTSNPIRNIVDALKPIPNPTKSFLSLSIGDATVYGNLDVPQVIKEEIYTRVEGSKYNGYASSIGYQSARNAIANKFTTRQSPLNENDIILANGCSGAIEIALSVLANPGDNILIPSPGFSFYVTLCGNKGFIPKYYSLIPELEWEANLEQMESLIDDHTRAIIITNPSNPCGSVFSKEHILAILAVAEKKKIPIVADEIYSEMVFSGVEFHPIGPLSTNVPILSVGGLGKRYMIPGWRLGWILIHDRGNAFSQVRDGLVRLSTVLLGPCTLSQSIVECALTKVPESYYTATMKTLEDNAKYLFESISAIDGLKPVKPSGAMYMMVGIDLSKFKDMKDDMDFCQKLMYEENFSVLPGIVFTAPNFVRLVISPPMDTLRDAVNRLREFCQRHSQ